MIPYPNNTNTHASDQKLYVRQCGRSEMQAEADNTKEINRRERIWFFPNKFWQATKGMAADEVSKLMEEVEKLAEAKDVEALRKYPFVYVGDPYNEQDHAA